MEGASEEKPLTLCRVFSETSRVIKSQRRTVIALAFLFVFPSSLATFLYGFLSPEKPPANTVLSLAFSLFSLLFSPLATGSITYTALNGFNGKPVKVKAAVKSIAASYFRLVATSLAIQLIVFLFAFAFALVMFFAVLGQAASPYLLGFAAAFLVSGTLYVQVNWILSSAVVVAESSSGFTALKRSKKLIEGKRWISLSLSLIFLLFSLVLFGINYYVTKNAAGLGGANRFVFLTLQFLTTVFSLMAVQLYSVIVSAVLYVDCKATEKAGGERSGEYVSLLADDDKVATIV